MHKLPDYLNPDLPAGLRKVCMPIVVATAQTIKDYGMLVDNPEDCQIEITRWPAQGWRPVDLDSGDEAGTKQGIFSSEWKGEILYGTNEAVGGKYILGFGREPEYASELRSSIPQTILIWHANYHPDGGQLFFPMDKQPFLVPLALPGDDIRPEHFIGFWFEGHQGLYIHANIWHEGVFTVVGQQRFLDRQGAVHARVSVDFAREFQCLLEMPLKNLEK